MRRLRLVSLFVTLAIAGTSVTVGAQDTRVRRQERIVIPPEVIVELERLSRDAFGENALREITREISRAMQDLSRDVGREFGREFGRGFEHAGGFAGAFVQDKNYKAEQTDRQTKTLAIGASGSLELENIVGNITVKAGGGRDATVEIVRTARGATEADAKAGLERVTVDVEAREGRGSVSVRYPDERRPNYYVSVALTVTAPAGTRLAVHSVTGDVSITGVKGDMEVNTTTGSVTIAQAGALSSVSTVTGKLTIRDVQSDAAIELSTMSGHIDLANIKARRLEVSAVAGDIIAHDVQAGGAELSCVSGQIEYSGAVVPSGRYEFSAHSGEIRLALTGGYDIEGQTFSGQIYADPALGLKVSTERRHGSLKGTVGKGGAFVEATTFSGSVKVLQKLN